MIGLDTILQKLKIKQIVGIIFYIALIITLTPNNIARILGLSIFKNKLQIYVSLSLIASISYYLFELTNFIFGIIMYKINNPKRVAIRYMKKEISEDEMNLIIKRFYNKESNSFVSSGRIDLNDGRKAALEKKYILYRASNISYGHTMFAYNLQPYVREFLNKKLKKGKMKIHINDDNISYNLY